MLTEHHGFKVSRETVRKWMQEYGIWLSRKQRRTFHQPRLRRECFGELIQIDGSDHRWFEDRGDPCTLLVFIDDATSTLIELRIAGISDMEAANAFLPDFMERYNDRFAKPAAGQGGQVRDTVAYVVAKKIPRPNMKLSMINTLQAGRFMAAMAVVLHHAVISITAFVDEPPNLIKSILNYGYLGVDFFFVLSGFIIHYTMSARHRPAIRFALDRLARILLPYWPVGIVLAVAYTLLPRVRTH